MAAKETESKRFRGIVGAGAPDLDDAALEAFDAAIRYHGERLDPGSESRIDASTARCRWRGEPMDYSTAIESMQFREEAARAPTVAPS